MKKIQKPAARKTRILFLIVIVLAALLAGLLPAGSGKAAQTSRHVFVLNSFNRGYTWTDNMLRGIDEAFASSGLQVETYVTFMDMKRIKPSPEYFTQLKDLIKSSYKDAHFEAVLVCDNDALGFIRQYRDELFPGLPVVFASINDFNPGMLDGRKDITGTSENTDYEGTVRLALKLRPETRTIVVVTDATTTGQAHRSAVEKIRKDFQADLGFTYLSLADMSMDEMALKLKGLSSDSVVLLLQHFMDKTGTYYTVQESTPLLAGSSSVPVFVVADIRVGQGALGGHVVSGYLHGLTAAQMVVKILNGADIATIPVLLDSPNQYLFDFKVLQRFNIAEASLPVGSVVLNKPPSPLDAYREEVIALGVVFVTLSLILIYLLFEIRRRKKIEQDLRLTRISVEAASDAMYWMTPDARVVDVNEAACRMLGYSREELLQLRVPDLDIHFNHAVWQQHFSELRQLGTLRFESEHRCKDGRLFPVEIVANFVRVGEEERDCAIVRDISERRHVEESLRASDEEQRVILQTAMDGFWVADMQGRILDVNDAYCRMSGFSRSELLEMRIPDLEVVESSLEIEEHIQKLKLQGQDRFETRHRRKDGSIFDLEISSQKQEIEGGGIVAFLRDITERKLDEQKLLESERRIQIKLNNLLSPEGDLGSLELIDIINVQALQDLMDVFYQISGFPVGIIDIHGRVLVKTGWQNICTMFHRVHPETNLSCVECDTALAEGVAYGEYKSYRCKNGLVDVVTPLVINDRHLGNLFTGQFFLDDSLPDREFFRAQAKRYGFDEAAYLDALDQVPHWKRESIDQAMKFYIRLVQIVTNLGASNITLVRSLEQRKLAEEALRKSEERLRDITFSLADWVWEMDANGIYTFSSQKGTDYFGPADEYIIGKTPFDFMPAEEASRVRKNFEETIRNKAPILDLENWNIKQDGTLICFLTNGLPILDENGVLLGYRGVDKNITERKMAEEQLLRAHAELEQRVAERTQELGSVNLALEKAARAKDEFLASMSHELRTPLTGILGLSEALQMVPYGDLTDKQLKAVKNIEQSGRHLLALINDILDLSKIEAGRLDLQVEACSLGEICQSSLQLTKGMANQKKQKISFSMQPASIVLMADARRMKQMIVNLLGNAIKFTQDGGRMGIDVFGDEQNHELMISVWDEGIGIQPDDVPRLFQPFVQLDSSLARQHSGTGLGLSLVQSLAEMHQGRVEVQSTPGEGSRFTIILPWVSVELQSEQAVDGAFTSFPAARSDLEDRPLVLMADDNQLVLDLFEVFLVSRNYRVIACSSGQEFLEQLDQVEADVILMDIQMPGIDGIEAIRRIRAHPSPRTAALPVIAVTALAMAGDRDRCMEAGVDAYLSKPVALLELLDTIEKLCLRKR